MRFQFAEADSAFPDYLGQEFLRRRFGDIGAGEPAEKTAGELSSQRVDLIRGIVASENHRIGQSRSVQVHQVGFRSPAEMVVAIDHRPAPFVARSLLTMKG